MNKTIAGLLSAAAVLTAGTAAQTVPTFASTPSPVSSYRDLLNPIPNALPLLKAADAQSAQGAEYQVAKTVIIKKGHHHHHHHPYHG